MANPKKFAELEQQLAQLKAEHEPGKPFSSYIDEVQKLRFVDETTHQEWLLNSEDGLWYIAPAGTNQFKLANPQPTQPVSPPEGGDGPKGPPPPPGPGPDREIEIPKGDQPGTDPGPKKAGSDFFTQYKNYILALGGLIALLIIFAILFFSGWGQFGSAATQHTDTATPALVPSPTLTTAPTALPTATPTTAAITSAPETPAAPSPSPSPTLTATPTQEPSPAVLLDPADTPTASPSPTHIPPPAPPPAAASTPTVPPAKVISGKLAYAYFDPAAQTFRLEVKDLTTDQLLLTMPQAGEPALTSDGNRLAYRSWQPDRIGLFAVSLADPDTRNTLSIYQEAHRLQWAPNNEAHIFTYLQQLDDREIKTIQFSDNDPPLALSGFGLTGTWAGHDRIVLNACEGTRCGLAAISTNGAGLTFLTDNPGDLSPAVSPDGQQIAYTSQQDGNWDVYLIGLGGGESTRLTNQLGKDGIPTWSPDGNFIAYASQQDGNWSIWLIEPETKTSQKLFDLPGPLEGKVPAFPDHTQPGWLFENISWSR